MLIALGAWALRGLRAGRDAGRTGLRPLFVGLVHGLAGSAGVALFALTTIPSTRGALGYLALFGLGTVLGMTLLTTFLSLPLGWMARTQKGVPHAAIAIAAVMSIGLGATLGGRVVIEASRPSSAIQWN